MKWRFLLAALLGINTACFAQQPSWTQFSPSGIAPTTSATGSATTGYDPVNDRLIVFGGSDPTQCCHETNNTWVLINASGANGTPTWQQLTPDAPDGLPPGRNGHTAIYDPGTNQLIIFGGGQTNGYAFSPLFNDVWILTNANGLGGTPQWIPRTPNGGPPAPREGHAAIYKQSTNEMFVFGGGNNGIMSVPNDLWVLENANRIDIQPSWVQLNQTGDVPPPWQGFASAYDPASDMWTIAIGCCYYSNASRVLALNGPSGIPQWTTLSPTGTLPPIGEVGNYFYDPDTHSLFAQTNGPGGWSNITWQLSPVNEAGVTPTWTNVIPSGTPGTPPTSALIIGSAYNAVTKRFIVALNRTDVPGTLTPEVWVLKLGFLRFPVLSSSNCPGGMCNPYNAPISSVFDHSMVVPYDKDNSVVAYTGAVSERQYGPGGSNASDSLTAIASNGQNRQADSRSPSNLSAISLARALAVGQVT